MGGKNLAVTYLGHSSVLVRLGGHHILTDPNYNPRMGLSKRKRQPGVPLDELPALDAVVISHAHLDHLDAFTLKQLPRQTRVVVPQHVGRTIRALGFDQVEELKLWQELQLGQLKVTAVPAKHWGSRYIFDFWKGYCGYILEGEAGTVYFAGDTDYFGGFRELGQRFTTDIALLPIGTYRPAFIMDRHHLNPQEALRAFKELGASFMVPIHWGTFRLSAEPVDEPLAWLKSLISQDHLKEKIWILEPGQSRGL